MKDSHGQTVQPEPTCDACGDVRGVCQHHLNQSEYPHAFDPRKRAVTTPMKDSHGLGDQLRTRVPTWTCPVCKMKFHTRAEYDAHRSPLSPSPEIRYQLRNWHHVTCLVAGGACTCLEQREALIAELDQFGGRKK